MNSLAYRFLDRIKYHSLPLNADEQNLILYALAHCFSLRKEIVCKLPLRDGFYFLCNGEENLDEFSQKTDKLFKVFSVKVEDKHTSIQFNLLNRVRVTSSKLILGFNSKNVELWLKCKEDEDMNLNNEMMMWEDDLSDDEEV